MELDALAFGAHPDDVEICCGGTIVKLGRMGYKTGVVTLTRAELGTRGSAEIRTKEFKEAAAIMGLAVAEQLDIPDSDVQSTWNNKLKVIRVLRAFKPKIVFTSYWKVRHPDHGHASHLVREAAFLAGLKKIDTGQEPHRPFKVIFYASRFEFKPSFIIDISEHHDQKIRAIQAYKSQFFNKEINESGEETYVSRKEFFEAIVTRAQQYGTYIGTKYGEPFLVREALRLDDPVAFFGPEYLNTIP